MPEPLGPTILEAMEDQALFAKWFAGSSWDAWRAVLAALFGLPMSEERVEIFRRLTGRTTPPTTQAREAWFVVGRRGGKSRISAVVAVFLACFVDYSAVLAPGEAGTVMVLAADKKQARVVLRYIGALIDGVPMLAEMVIRRTAEEIHLANGIVLAVHTSSYRTVRGYTVVAAILDECAFWHSDEESANLDVEVVNAVRPATATVPNALILGISSPYARRGILWLAYHHHFSRDGDPVLVVQGATRDLNPAVDEAIIRAAYEQDEAAASAEYGAQFRRDIEAFVPREVVEALVVAGRAPVAGVKYFAFTDPSGGAVDSMTLAIAHKEKGRAVLDAIRERRAPFSPEDVVREFAAIVKEYGIGRVVGDRYAGEWPRERFREHGIVYEPAEPTKSEFYGALLPLLMSATAQLLDDRVLVHQLCALERRTSRAGKDSISHPPGGRDDVANAAAGALVLAAGRHAKMLAEWRDVPAPARPETLDDLLPRPWTCPRCGSTCLVGPDVKTPRCARCHPGWTWNQIVHGGGIL